MATGLNEQAMQSAALAGNKCGVCKRTGFPLFLVRKSVIPIKEKGNVYWSKGMKKEELKERLPSEELEAHEYAYRVLREGYVYVFVKRKDVNGDKRRVIAFESMPKGGFRHRSIQDIKEGEIEDIPNKEECTKNNHRLIGLFLNIDIDPTFYQDEAWIAYSRRAWSDEVRKYYQNAPESELERFTKIKFNDETAKNPDTVASANRSFCFNSFLDNSKHLIEFEREQLGESTIACLGQVNLFDIKSQYLEKDENTTKTIINKLQTNNKKIPVVVVEDCFGLAYDLNSIRNMRLAPYFEEMIKSEKELTEDIKNGLNKALSLDKDKTTKDLAKDNFESYRVSDPMIELFYKKPDYYKLFNATLGLSIADGYSQASNNEYYKQVVEEEINFKRIFEIEIKGNNPLSKYFSKDLTHKRKIKSWIDDYKGMLKNYYLELNKDKKGYIYFDNKGTPYEYTPLSIDQMMARDGEMEMLVKSRSYIENESLYKELPLDESKKVELIKGTHYYENIRDVKLFSIAEIDAETQFNEKWKSFSARIDQEVLDTFDKKDKKYYQEILEQITTLSKDYLINLTWLIGSKHKSKHAYNLTSYNDIRFWEFEFQADGCHEHLGFLSDVGDILSMSYTGTIKLPEQFGIWDALFSSEESLYFYALTGKRDAKVAEVNKSSNPQYQEKNTSILTTYRQVYNEHMTKVDNSNKDRIDVINKVVSVMNSISDQKWDKDNVSNFMLLYQRLFNNALEGISNSTIKLSSSSVSGASQKQLAHFASQLTNKDLVSVHFQDSARLLQTIEIKVARLQLSPKEFVNMLQNLMKRKVITINAKPGETITYQPAAGQPSVSIKMDDKNNIKLFGKKDKLITTDVVFVGNTAQEIAQIEQDIIADKGKATVKEQNDKIVGVGGNAENVALSAKEQVEKERNQVKVDATKAMLVNSTLLVLDAISLWNTLDKLNKADEKILGVEEKNALSHELFKTSISLINNSVEVIGAVIKFYSLSGFKLYPYGKEINYLQSGLAGNVSKICSLLSKGTSAFLAIYSICDGATSIAGSILRAKNGDVGGVLYTFGCAFQIASGIYTLISIFYPIPYLGQIMFIVGLAAMALTYFFKDKSSDWSLMEKWFDLCYFGRRYTQGKESPFPLNAVGLFLCLNQYIMALNGASAVIDFTADDALYDAKKENGLLEKILETNANIDQATLGVSNKPLYKSIILKVKLPNFDLSKSYFEGTLFISSLGSNKNTSMELEFKYNRKKLIVSPLKTQLDSFILREDFATRNKKSKELYGRDIESPSVNENDFLIHLKLGEINGLFHFVLKLNYWPEGNTTSDSEQSFPLLLSYDYKG